MTLPRQERRDKPRNNPPAAALDPAVPNPAALRLNEQTVLGWLLSAANHAEAKAHLVDIEVRHFYVAAHQEIYAAIMGHAGAPNIAALVAMDLAADTAHRSVRELPGGITGYLSECKEYADLYGEREFAYHVRQVKEAYVRRRRLEVHGMATRALEEDNLDAYEAALSQMHRLGEDLSPSEDPDQRQERLRRQAISDASANRYLAVLADEVIRTRARREAKRLVDAEEADDAPIAEPISLEDLLSEEDEQESWRMSGLWPMGARILLAAGAKAGKTTMTGNVLRSLTDGDRFLGVHEVAPVNDGRTIAVLDYEMPRSKVKAWLRDQKIRNPASVRVWTERGRAGRFDTRDPTAQAKWAARLQAANVSVWIIDCLSPILSALGIDENNNTEVGAILDGINTIAASAGVDDVLLIHHMGHSAERSRGASRLIGWPDVNWKLTRRRDDKDPTAEPDPDAPRYFSAYGRDVDVREGRLVYEPSTRHLTYVEGGRKQDGATANLARLLLCVRDNPGLSGRQIEMRLQAVGVTRDPARAALRTAIDKRYVEVSKPNMNAVQHHLTAVGRMQIAALSVSPPSDEEISSGVAGAENVDCPTPGCGYYVTASAWAEGARRCSLCDQETA